MCQWARVVILGCLIPNAVSAGTVTCDTVHTIQGLIDLGGSGCVDSLTGRVFSNFSFNARFASGEIIDPSTTQVRFGQSPLSAGALDFFAFDQLNIAVPVGDSLTLNFGFEHSYGYTGRGGIGLSDVNTMKPFPTVFSYVLDQCIGGNFTSGTCGGTLFQTSCASPQSACVTGISYPGPATYTDTSAVQFAFSAGPGEIDTLYGSIYVLAAPEFGTFWMVGVSAGLFVAVYVRTRNRHIDSASVIT